MSRTVLAEDFDMNAESDLQSTPGQPDKTSPNVSIRNEMRAALEAVIPSSSFAGYENLDEAPLLGLEVRGVGDVSLPLEGDEVDEVIAQARFSSCSEDNGEFQSPFADTWELYPDQLIFHNPGWPDFLSSLGATASRILGTHGNVRLTLDKMLIYSEGATVEEHGDMPTQPGAFGTLIIRLPSKFDGGDMKLKHNDEIKAIRPSQGFQSIACWYSSVSLKLSPIKSGYFWLLRYNLFVESGGVPRPPATETGDSEEILRHTITQWLDQSKQSHHHTSFFYLLRHMYAYNISTESLLPHELSQLLTLQRAADGLPVHVFLAVLKKTQSGPCQYSSDDYSDTSDYEDDKEGNLYSITDVTQESFEIMKLVDANGENDVVLNPPTLSEDEILNEYVFDAGGPSAEGYFMDNGQPSAKRSYHKTAIAVVSHDHFATLLRSNKSTVPYVPLHLMLPELDRVDCYPIVSEQRVLAFEVFCERLWDESGGSHADDLFDYLESKMEQIMKFFVVHEKFDVFKKIVCFHRGRLPVDFYVWLRRWLVQRNDASAIFHDTQDSLASSVYSYSSFSRRFIAVALFAPVHPMVDAKQSTVDMLHWARETLNKVAAEEEYPNPQSGCLDAAEMIRFAMYFEHPIEVLSEWVSNLFGNEHVDASFFLHLLRQLDDDMASKYLKKKKTMPFFRSLAAFIIESLDLSKIRKPSDPTYSQADVLPHEEGLSFGDRIGIINSSMETLFTWTFQQGKKNPNLIDSLLAKCIAQAPEFSAWQLQRLWMRLLLFFVNKLRIDRLPMDQPLFLEFCITIITQFLEKFVGHEPVVESDLDHPKLDCYCVSCTWVNAFLANPVEKIGTFIVGTHIVSSTDSDADSDADDNTHDSIPDGSQDNGVSHIVEQLNKETVDCLHKLSYDADTWQPTELVVMKTSINDEKGHQKWREKRGAATRWLDRFNEEGLQILLGPHHETIVNMAHLVAGRDCLELPSVSTMAEAARQLQHGAHPWKRRRLAI